MDLNDPNPLKKEVLSRHVNGISPVLAATPVTTSKNKTSALCVVISHYLSPLTALRALIRIYLHPLGHRVFIN